MKAERIVLIAALVAGASYVLAPFVVPETPAMIAWKGTGVALLALWCSMHARSTDGWLIAAAIGAGAVGDVLLEAAGMIAGAAAFLLGHLIAIALYLCNRRSSTTASQKALAATVAVVTPLLAWFLTDSANAALYALALGLMAATAWTSAFPRYRTGLGAMLFVASDLLIFAKLGPLAGAPRVEALIWPLYFAGQVLIATGVIRTLTSSRA